MTVPSPIQRSENHSMLRLEWHNRVARQDRFLFWFILLFLLAWTSITCWATGMTFTRLPDPLFLIGLCVWSIFAWGVVFSLVYTLLSLSWTEVITMSQESVVCGQRGLLAPRSKSIPADAVTEITIGFHYVSDDAESRESCVTLNVHYRTAKGHPARRIVGYWLHPSLKEMIFHDMQQFAEKHNVPLTFRRYQER